MAFVEQIIDRARDRLVTISESADLLQIARLLHAGTDIVAVSDAAGKLTGIITKTDLIERLTEEGSLHQSMTAASVMRRQVTTCTAADKLDEVWGLMRARDFKNVPIVADGNRPLGILNARDALQLLLQESEDEEALLRDYVIGIGYR